SCLTAIAGQTQDAPSMVARVEALGAQTFTGKTPGDVLERVAEVRNRVNALRSRAGSDAVRVFDDHSGTVTPSVVFLNSGYVLDGLADWLARRDNPSVRVMTCYQPRNFSSKTPSDVFGLVDLAMRRADLVFAR
ncbi:MAG: hypothetical protein ACE5FM_07575, partial [Methyloligellaceae bacterium]